MRAIEVSAAFLGVRFVVSGLIDAQGVVRFVDVRRNYQFWLDPGLVEQAIASLQ